MANAPTLNGVKSLPTLPIVCLQNPDQHPWEDHTALHLFVLLSVTLDFREPFSCVSLPVNCFMFGLVESSYPER